MLDLLAEATQAAPTDLWGLAGGGVVGGGLIGGILYWITRVLVPRLMEQFEKAQAGFATTLEASSKRRAESEAAFLQALALQRGDFKGALTEQAKAVGELRQTAERVAVQMARLNDNLLRAESSDG